MELLELLAESPEVELEKHSSRADWLVARQRSLGASDVATIMGLSHRTSPFALWIDKTTRVEAKGPAWEEPIWLRLGHVLEPFVAAEYSREAGEVLEDPGDFTIVRNSRFPHLHATLDRVAAPLHRLEESSGGGVGLGRWELGAVQLKTTSDHSWGDAWPLEVRLQVQMEMAVAGLHRGALAALVSNQAFTWERFDHRPDVTEHVAKVTLDWWERHVVGGEPPPIDNHPDTRSALRKRHRRSEPLRLQLPPSADEVLELWERAEELKKGAESDVDFARNVVMDWLGLHQEGVTLLGREVTWKPRKDGARVLLKKKWKGVNDG